MKNSLSPKLTKTQKLSITPQMKQSLRILELSSFDLKKLLEEASCTNPIIELKYTDYCNLKENTISPLDYVSYTPSTYEYIINEINENITDSSLKKILFSLTGFLDTNGYLTDNLESICNFLNIPTTIGYNALKELQNLEPAGIGARSLKECLLLQLDRKNLDNMYIRLIIENHLNLIADNNYPKLAKILNISINEAQVYGDIIKTLDPKPLGKIISDSTVPYIIPDASIDIFNNEIFIHIENSNIPKISLNKTYIDNINKSDNNTKAYIKTNLKEANFIIKSIEHRNVVFYEILKVLCSIQKEYFFKGPTYLSPMTLNDISSVLNMHQSTISRALKDKYLKTPYGIVSSKVFFSSSIKTKDSSSSSSTLKSLIKNIIESEDSNNPLSDQEICTKLNSLGYTISRRTIAKYRISLGIESASKRKRF